MSQMLKSSGATAIATMVSRVLGLVREIAYAHFMGRGGVADAFQFAFTIPNLFRRLLGEGALTAAFIPVFKQKEKSDGLESTWRAANAVISALLLATAAIVVLGIIVISVLLWSGVFRGDEGTTLMLRLLRVMLPYVVLVCFAAIAIGMLNARGHFFIPALSAALLNVAMIASVYLIAPHMGLTLPEQIFGLAVGVLIAGVAQAAFQMPLLRREGFRYRWVNPWKNETVRIVIRQMLPATIGVAAFQINVVVANTFAFAVGKGILSGFNYAVRLMELPQGVFGLSLATYLLPTLSGLAAEKKYPEFRTTMRDAIGYLLFVNLLAAVLLFVLAEPMVRLLFEGRSFKPQDTPEVAVAVMALAPGLIAFSFVNIFGRAFYALGDTATPMKISVFCLILNALLTFPLVWMFKQAGMGIANSATGFINVGLLTFALRKKLARLELAELRQHAVAFAASAMAAAAIAWAAQWFWEHHHGHAALWQRLVHVFAPILLATAGYFGVAFAFRIPYAHDFLKLVRRRVRG